MGPDKPASTFDCVRLTAHESLKQAVIVQIGCAQSLDVAHTDFIGCDQVSAPPGERRKSLLSQQAVGHQARVATVAIGEWVQRNQLVMKTDSNLFAREYMVFQPISRVVEKVTQVD